MTIRLFLCLIVVMLSSIMLPARADTQLAHITNNTITAGVCYVGPTENVYSWTSFWIGCENDFVNIAITHYPFGPYAIRCGIDVTTPGYYVVVDYCNDSTHNSYTLFKIEVENLEHDPVPPPQELATISYGSPPPGSLCSIESLADFSSENSETKSFVLTCGSNYINLISITSDEGCNIIATSAAYTIDGSCDNYTIYKHYRYR